MSQKIIDFYNKESTTYSFKRYESKMVDFTQFYFRKRLFYIIKFLTQITKDRNNLELLEIGCADGIIIKKININFPYIFKKIIGIDISPEMIRVAKKQILDEKISFFVREEYTNHTQFDLVLSVGYLTKDILNNEAQYVLSILKEGGFYLCSLSLKNSLRMRLKYRDAIYSETHLTIKEYEEILSNYFKIVKKETYGLFIPKLWKIPFLAQILQPFFESVFKYIIPELFHERIYLLKKED